MRIVGRAVPGKQQKDNRVYRATCKNSKCRMIIEFKGFEIQYVHEEGILKKGDYGSTYKTPSKDYYAITCPNCNEYICLGPDERSVMNYLKSEREKFKAIKKYDDEHVADYD